MLIVVNFLFHVDYLTSGFCKFLFLNFALHCKLYDIFAIAAHDAKPGELDNYLKLYKNYADEVRKLCVDCDLLGSWKVFYASRDQAVHLWRFKHGYEDIDR